MAKEDPILDSGELEDELVQPFYGDSKEEMNHDESDAVEFSFVQWMLHYKILLGVLIAILILLWNLNDLRARSFAAFMDRFIKAYHGKLDDMKKDVFATLGSVVSHDPTLRKIGAIKILEIGVGTGTNFAYYPDGTRLTVVDPNPHFKAYYDANRKQFKNIHSEDIILAKGEEMTMIPDNSVDVVVVTLVFCSVSVQDTPKLLKQILRVLAPGGKFYFYEHTEEFDATNHSLRKRIQNLLTKSGIWPFLLDSCHLNRDMLKAVESVGFSKVEAQRFYAPFDHPVFQVLKPSLRGVAQK